ncbi:zinc transporter ZIP4 [Grus americana]|uniref:zinc transporter ZIP4 n=1 Tax=Grus americana TaxID=9117 RepID=UPI002407FBF5|nr:zinc transporter ZIP4 [Grus americana]
MTPLLLLLLLGLGATGRDPPGAAEPVSALEALLSSGSGSLPRGAVESLVGIAAGRAQCRAGPCGKCLSADAVLALAGKSGAAAQLEAAEVPWLGAAILVTLRDPPGACRDADADTGPWAARVRALHRAFTGNGTGNGTGSGPGLREVGELLAAVQHNYRGTDSRQVADGGVSQRGVGVSQPCVDAAEVLAAGAAASPRVGAGRVLGALGALVLRGRCLRPPPPPGFFLDYVFHRFGHGAHGLPPEGLSALMEQLGLSPGEQPPSPPPSLPPSPPPQSRPWDTLCLAPPELLEALGLPGGAALSRGDFLRLSPALLHGQRHGAAQHHPEVRSGFGGGARPDPVPAAGAGAVMVSPVSPRPALAATVAAGHRCRGAERGRVAASAASAPGGAQPRGGVPRGGVPHPRRGGGEEPAAPWKLLGVLGGLFAAFLLEKLLGILLHPREEDDPQDDPDCHPHCDPHCPPPRDPPVGQQQQQAGACGEPGKVEDANSNQGRREPQNKGLLALPCVLTLGAAAHSLADGLALGVAFSASWRSGAATALALLCHELPHALGDAAVLAQAGLSARRVLALRLGGSVPAVPGLCTGLALGTARSARTWLGAAATGLLLHLGLCDVVPAMVSARSRRPWVLLGLQSAGLLGGWGVLLLLALYEESILL